MTKVLTRYDMYRDVPYFNLIRENETVVIPSIFMFASCDELYPFLAACEEYNSTVIFENEQLTVPPKDDINKKIEVFAYVTVLTCRKIGDDYVRYLGNLAKMNWVDGEHEPILK